MGFNPLSYDGSKGKDWIGFQHAVLLVSEGRRG